MKTLLRYAPVLALAAFLAGCQGSCGRIEPLSGPAVTSGSADFTTYAAVGTSISAGWQSGGLVDRHQVRSFPADFAQQIGKTVQTDGMGSFTLPTVDHDGIPALLAIQSFSPLIISNAGRTTGAPENFSQATAYHNLGVPGAIALDFADSSNYYTTNAPLFRSNFTMFNLIVRHRGTIAQQLFSLQPTFISFEYGANEVLAPATSGVSTPNFPAASYAAILTGDMNAIHTVLPNAKLALFNVPAVTTIPFSTTFKPFTADGTTGSPVALIGPDGALAATDLVLLTAQDSLVAGTGFPIGSVNYLGGYPGNGRPLTNSQVLSTAEQGVISGITTAMNAAVDSVSNRPWITKVDMNGLLRTAATTGLLIGNTTYTSAFVTGGIFSLDGVHPNDLAQAVLCNAMIDAVDAKFGATLSRINPLNYASATASRLRPATNGDGQPIPRQVVGLEDGLRALFPWRH